MNGVRTDVKRRLLAVTAVFAAAALMVGCRNGDQPEDRAPERASRRIVRVAWDTAFVVASSAHDSMLLMPIRPRAGGEGVYLADFYGNRVVHFGRDGGLRWSFGRKGAGPDEFQRIRDLKVDSNGHVWVLDQTNQRLTVLDPAGGVVRRVSLAAVGRMPDAVVPLEKGGALVLAFDPETPLVRIQDDGRVVDRGIFPWPRYRTLNPMAAQLTTASDPATGKWIAAFQTGNGFFPFRDTAVGGYQGQYVEAVEFPEVEEIRNGSSVETRMKTRPVFAARSISLSPTRLYVLFAGTGPYARRIVDSYALEDGHYVESLLMPRLVDEIAWGDGGLYVTYSNPYPAVALWRPRNRRLP